MLTRLAISWQPKELGGPENYDKIIKLARIKPLATLKSIQGDNNSVVWDDIIYTPPVDALEATITIARVVVGYFYQD